MRRLWEAELAYWGRRQIHVFTADRHCRVWKDGGWLRVGERRGNQSGDLARRRR